MIKKAVHLVKLERLLAKHEREMEKIRDEMAKIRADRIRKPLSKR